ncbi:MAG TPA: response regulator transcription factor [Blastocatellia bacterium]|nr:response regulator transcription factor [Blastocatellia bacterium]
MKVFSEVKSNSPLPMKNQKNCSVTSQASKLSSREREVIALVCEGLSNSEIAERLFISPITVRHHLSAIYRKLGVTNRLKLVIYAFRHRIVAGP